MKDISELPKFLEKSFYGKQSYEIDGMCDAVRTMLENARLKSNLSALECDLIYLMSTSGEIETEYDKEKMDEIENKLTYMRDLMSKMQKYVEGK